MVMATPAPVEQTEKPSSTAVPPVFREAFENTPAEVLDPTKQIVTSDQVHQQTAQKITGNLSQIGYPGAEVLPGSSAAQTLNEIHRAGIGAKPGFEATAGEVVALGADVINQGLENLGQDLAGGKHSYTTTGKKGHELLLGKVADRVRGTGVPEKIKNLLFGIRRGK